MSLVNKLRSGGAIPPERSSGTQGGVSGGLRSKLGEELAAMLEKVGRKVYAAAMEKTRKAIADSLLANRTVLSASLRQEFGRRGSASAKQAIAEWLDEVVGEVLTDVAEEVYKDLPDISESLVEQVSAEDDEMPPMEDEEAPEEEDEEEPEDEDEEAGMEYAAADADSEELQAIADELEEIKAAGLAQAARLAAAGDPDSAAFCRMVMDQL